MSAFALIEARITLACCCPGIGSVSVTTSTSKLGNAPFSSAGVAAVDNVGTGPFAGGGVVELAAGRAHIDEACHAAARTMVQITGAAICMTGSTGKGGYRHVLAVAAADVREDIAGRRADGGA